MGDYEIRTLTSETWPAYAALIEKHHGIFGGCWDTYFHSLERDPDRTYDSNRALKCRLVEEGRAHAAVVFDGDVAVGWCQYGSPDELPNIHHRKQYLAEADVLPDYRLTCIFVDRDHRRQGVTELAIRGALDLIAAAGAVSSRVTPTRSRPRRSRRRSSTTPPDRSTSGWASSTSGPRA